MMRFVWPIVAECEAQTDAARLLFAPNSSRYHHLYPILETVLTLSICRSKVAHQASDQELGSSIGRRGNESWERSQSDYIPRGFRQGVLVFNRIH